MIWFFVLAGIALLAVGLLGSTIKPGQSSQPVGGGRPARAKTGNEAWDVLARPMDREELIKIPGAGNRDRRFLYGIFVGLGIGLMVTASALAIQPASTTPQPVAANKPTPPVSTPPTKTTPAPTTPAPTTPAPTTPPTVKPPTNVTIVVESGNLLADVGAKLKAAGLVPDSQKFVDRMTARGLDTRLKAATFNIPSNASLDQIIDILTA